MTTSSTNSILNQYKKWNKIFRIESRNRKTLGSVNKAIKEGIQLI